MSELVIASNEADAHDADAVRQNHSGMAGALGLRTEALLTAASQRDTFAAEHARLDLVGWCERELVPHALAEEQALYLAAHATVEGRLLVEAMLGEHEHEPAAADADDVSTGCAGHTCECGEVDGRGYPELDVRSIPHAIRHATIFGALESVHPGAVLEMVAPHDPLPLLDQVNQRWPGAFSVAYSERGPKARPLSLVRTDV